LQYGIYRNYRRCRPEGVVMQATAMFAYAAELEQAFAYTAADERAWEAATPYVMNGEARYTEAGAVIDRELVDQFGPEGGDLYLDYRDDIFAIEQGYDTVHFVVFH
jgi:hypothetical protein